MGCDRWARDGGIDVNLVVPLALGDVFSIDVSTHSLDGLGLSDVSPEQYDSRMCIIQIIKFPCICGNH